jgi:pimeloyl-ACP methyl ester carboxylesterase
MTLAHARAGRGRRPLVLLHGLLGSARNLTTLTRLLLERDPHFDIVAFDLTGHGASPPLPAGADANSLAADVLSSARGLGLTPPLAFVGHSLGGRVALCAARREPEWTGVVTLLDIAPGPLRTEGEVSRVLDALLDMPAAFASRRDARARLMAAGLSQPRADWLLLNGESAGDGYRWRIDRRALADLHASVAAEDLWPVVEGRRRWTLRCVRGAASAYVSGADVPRLEAAGCPVTTIEGAGHFLHADRPEAVADAVAAALV